MHLRQFSTVTVFISSAIAALAGPAVADEPGAGQHQSPAVMVIEDLDSPVAPRGEAVTRATGTTAPKRLLIRDADNPALQPVRFNTVVNQIFINSQAHLTTVPTGKRLVLEDLSWRAENIGSAEMVFGALRAGEFGPIVANLEVNPPHRSASSSFTLQDGAQPARIYFSAGEEVWVSVSKNIVDGANFFLYASGYYVNVR